MRRYWPLALVVLALLALPALARAVERRDLDVRGFLAPLAGAGAEVRRRWFIFWRGAA